MDAAVKTTARASALGDPHAGGFMPTYTQVNRPISVTTPLGADKLLLIGFSGEEAVSRLYRFQLEVLAENATDVAFDKLLGQDLSITLELPDGKKRYFAGI
jgi:type VI secretion system secreted protein VgrG